MKYFTFDKKKKDERVTIIKATEGKNPGVGKKLAEAEFFTDSKIGERNAERGIQQKLGRGHKIHRPPKKKKGFFSRIFKRGNNE